MAFDFESKDASAINIRVEIRQLVERKCSTPDGDKKEEVLTLWGSSEFTLDRILNGGHKGFEVPIGLDLEIPITKYSAKHMNKVLYPGTIFLRGEIITPAVFGVSLLSYNITCSTVK